VPGAGSFLVKFISGIRLRMPNDTNLLRKHLRRCRLWPAGKMRAIKSAELLQAHLPLPRRSCRCGGMANPQDLKMVKSLFLTTAARLVFKNKV
jgi:hypothetical protein